MALPDTVKWESPNSRTTGISSASVAAGANYLGSAIDNRTNLDQFCTIELLANFGTAPSANKVVLVYLLYSLDGTNFEDGSASVDPATNPVGALVTRAVTGDQRVIFPNVPLDPHQFKVLVNNDSDQSATITVSLYTQNTQVVD